MRTVMGETVMEGSSDAGSIPASSILYEPPQAACCIYDLVCQPNMKKRKTKQPTEWDRKISKKQGEDTFPVSSPFVCVSRIGKALQICRIPVDR